MGKGNLMHQQIEHIKQTVTGWPGMTANPHRFGGLEFNLGTVEIGHIHADGMVDIPFNTKIRTQLLTEKPVGSLFTSGQNQMSSRPFGCSGCPTSFMRHAPAAARQSVIHWMSLRRSQH
jgi:hypothetical protein